MSEENIEVPPNSAGGRKYRLTLISLFLLTIGMLLSSLNPLIPQIYAEFAGGVIGILLVYCGGNVSNKWVLGKVKKQIETTSPQEAIPANPNEDESGG